MDKQTATMKTSGAYTLFVTLPNRTTHSVRRLPKEVHVAEVKVRLEVEVGIPSHVYVMFFGDAELNDTDVIEFRAGVKNGVLLRVFLTEQWKELYSVVEKEDSEAVVKLSMTDAQPIKANKEDPEEGLDGQRAATALFMASHYGYLQIVQNLTEAAGAGATDLVLFTVGSRGRCSLHAGAAGDQVQVLEVLLTCGAQASVTDQDGCSPADIAAMHGAYIAERFLQSHILKRKGMVQALSLVGRATQRSATAHACSTSHVGSSPSPTINERPSQRPDSATAILNQQSRSIPFKSPHCKKQIRRTMEKTKTTVATPQPSNKAPQRRKPRIKSAPIKMQQQQQETDIRNHGHCASRRPFMAFRSVPREELRSETVEYVPLSPRRFIGHDQRTQDRQVLTQMNVANGATHHSNGDVPHAPCSSLNTSLEDLSIEEEPAAKEPQQATTSVTSILPVDATRVATTYQWKPPGNLAASEKTVTWVDINTSAVSQENTEVEKKASTKQALVKEYTRPEGTRTKRAQSARYYRSKYHEQAEEERYYQTIPRPRPESAGPRYRAWKTWLLQKYEEDAKKALMEQKNAARRERCTRTFNRWLRKKYKQLEEQSDSEDSDDYEDNTEENNKAFEKWLESKRPYFLQQKKLAENPSQVRNGKMTVFQIGCTNEAPLRPVDFNSYMRVHHKWYAKKKQYEDWKKRKGMAQQSGMARQSQHSGETAKWTPEEIAEMRRHLVLQGCTYEEWMGLKTREQRINPKLHVTAFGETSPRKWVMTD